MTTRQINAADAAAPAGAYTQALEVTGTTRRLYVSGQPPVRADGSVPSSFEEQAELVWRNILAQLDAADMSAEHLVKAMTFLADRAFIAENRDVRQRMLGGRIMALIVVLAGMFDDAWLLEIDAIAEA